MSASERTCPACGTLYQSTWRWCLACGDDPDGVAPAPIASYTAPAPKPAASPAKASKPSKAPRTPDAPAAAPSKPVADRDRAGDGGVKVHARRKTEQVLAEAKADGPWSLALIAIIGVLLAGGVYLYRVRAASSDTGTPTGVASTVPIEWASYTPEDGSFTVDLPGKPFVNPTDTKLGGAPAIRTEYMTLAGNTNIGISVTVPNDPAAAAPATAADLTAFVADLAARMNAKVTGTTPIDYNGSPGLDYVIDINGVGQNRGRIIGSGAKVFNIYIVAAQPNIADLERVSASFAPA